VQQKIATNPSPTATSQIQWRSEGVGGGRPDPEEEEEGGDLRSRGERGEEEGMATTSKNHAKAFHIICCV
jgi:hypothetical protein